MNVAGARSLFPLLLSGVLLAGCGSSSSSPSSSSASTQGASTPATAVTAVVVTTKHEKKLGTVLAAGSKRLTVYLFEADKGSSSSCAGDCAKVWPPVTGKPNAAGKAITSDLGMITRSDGTTQVTYKGHPLYYYIKDKDGGDAYGQGIKSFGAPWYGLAPSGRKVDMS